MRIFILVIFLLHVPLHVFSYHYKGKNVVVTSGFESKGSFITYVSIDGHPYLVKQKKGLTSQLGVVREALAAYVADVFAIAHSVELIAAEADMPGKINTRWPATLHTIAPGKEVRDLGNHKYVDVYLKQRCKPNAKHSEIGLTEEIIHQITWHKQLPIILALDLFLCNSDRHRGNLFYDTKTDRFCAIDMEGILKCDVPALACEKLQHMIAAKKKFTKKEKKALAEVIKTIEFLLDTYSVELLIGKLRSFAEEAGFCPYGPLCTEKIAKSLSHNETIILQSCTSCRRLIAILNGIISGK